MFTGLALLRILYNAEIDFEEKNQPIHKDSSEANENGQYYVWLTQRALQEKGLSELNSKNFFGSGISPPRNSPFASYPDSRFR